MLEEERECWERWRKIDDVRVKRDMLGKMENK